MKRRSFLKKSSLTGLSLTGITASAVAASLDTAASSSPSDTPPANQVADFPLAETTIQRLQEKMRSGEYTAHSIAQLYLRRIAAIDRQGPALNAVIELNPEALSIADKMDAERKAGKVRGPLHGIPVLIKDNIDTGDTMMTTAGSLALEGHKAAQDAFIVAQLRAAGAVILGKTNCSEWANFRSTRSTSGWSSRGGQTKNPFLLARNPSGSSAGSGSAVSANLCAVAVGTETNGSIVSPSSICGIVGIKPTVGLLSRSGIIPISRTQDTAGPMTRTVTDAVLLLGAMTGIDPSDEVTKQSEGKSLKDYTKFLDPNGLKGKKIGIEKSFLSGHEGILALFQTAIDTCKAQGATIVEIDLFKLLSDPNSVEGLILQYEFKDGLNKYLSTAGAAVKNLTDVIAFNKANEKRAMPFFKQETLEKSDTLQSLETPEYTDALKKLLTTRTIIDDLLKKEGLDALCAVTDGPACLIDLVTGDYFTGPGFSGPAAMAGYPHITVPMGLVMGLPVGISFVGTAYTEGALIQMAYAYEQASKKRTAPQMINAANP